MFTVRANVYATPDGKATHERTHDSGKNPKPNRLILAQGALVSDEQADELGLRELGKELDKKAMEAAKKFHDPVEALKAKDDEPAAATTSAPPMGDAPKTEPGKTGTK